jgi:hypothetical protein
VNNLERHGFMRTDLVTVILLPYLDAVTMLWSATLPAVGKPASILRDISL